jgi:PKHD-type hydroxylase
MSVLAFFETIDAILTEAECDELLSGVAALPSVKDAFAKVRVTPIPPERFRDLYKRIFEVVAAANARTWQISLDGWLSLQVLTYAAGDEYGWHTDLADPRPRGRVFKLALSLLLSRPDAFVGGELELMLGSYRVEGGVGGGPSLIAPLRRRGAGVLFPSYLVHRIRPVTAGTRVVLVARLGGTAFV